MSKKTEIIKVHYFIGTDHEKASELSEILNSVVFFIHKHDHNIKHSENIKPYNTVYVIDIAHIINSNGTKTCQLSEKCPERPYAIGIMSSKQSSSNYLNSYRGIQSNGGYAFVNILRSKKDEIVRFSLLRSLLNRDEFLKGIHDIISIIMTFITKLCEIPIIGDMLIEKYDLSNYTGD